jgi:hypothetical protein
MQGEANMSEWQPARVIEAHLYKGALSEDQRRILHALVVRIRPAIPPSLLVKKFRNAGCNAEHFFEVNKDDLTPVGYEDYPNVNRWVCEHQILTD